MGRLVLGLAMGAVLVSACGARVGPYLGSTGAQVAQSPGSNSQGTSASATTTTAAATTQTTAGSTGSGAGSGGTQAAGSAGANSQTPAASIAPASFNFSAAAEAGDCPGSAGNTASDTGVTPSQITIGNVSGETGPLTSSFDQGGQGVQALFQAVNGAGGICGRKLVLDEEDDQQNSSNNATDTQDLIPKVFAFAGSTSDADNGGVPFINQANVPDFGYAINCVRSESADYWSAAGGSCEQMNGKYYINDSAFLLAKQGGYFPSKMAFLSYSISISALAAQEYAYVYQALGGTVCYEDFSISPATASLESDVAQMQADGCNGVITTMDVTGNAKMLQALQQQSVSLPYVATTFDGYTPDQITDAGQSAAQGLIVSIPFTPLNEPNPIVQLYLQQLRTYEPGDSPSGFGFLAWESTQLMIYALIKDGHNPTRASLTQVLNGIQNWDGGGSLGAYTPASHSFTSCDVDVSVQGNNFVRKAPASGIFCGGQLVQASS